MKQRRRQKQKKIELNAIQSFEPLKKDIYDI